MSSDGTTERSERPRRPVVLTFLAAYVPAFRSGGPIRTLEAMVAQMSDRFEFRIVAADRDFGDAAPFDGVEVNCWTTCGEARVFYRSPGPSGWRALLRSLEGIDYELIYLNSLFGTEAALRPLMLRRLGRLAKRPVLLAPRGELDPGALAIKPIKKAAFIRTARALRLFKGVFWHASNPAEREAVVRHMEVQPGSVFEAMDLSGRSSSGPPPIWRHRQAGPLRLVFLSRISPKKNLLYVLEVLSRISVSVSLDIYGVIEDEAYWSRCKAVIASLPDHVTAGYRGEVSPAEVERTFAAYDLFFFPTLGENYGHVIREAMSAGLPVLMSDTTPWRDLAARNVGADLPLDDAPAFAAWIEDYSRLPESRLVVMRSAAREMGNDTVRADENLRANVSMLNTLITGQSGI